MAAYNVNSADNPVMSFIPQAANVFFFSSPYSSYYIFFKEYSSYYINRYIVILLCF